MEEESDHPMVTQIESAAATACGTQRHCEDERVGEKLFLVAKQIEVMAKSCSSCHKFRNNQALALLHP